MFVGLNITKGILCVLAHAKINISAAALVAEYGLEGFNVLFSFATQYSLSVFGEPGLNFIAIVVGFADVDPFLMNIFQDHTVNQTSSLVSPCLIAIMSNIVLKTMYIKIWASEEVRKLALPRMLILFLCGAICLIINQFI